MPEPGQCGHFAPGHLSTVLAAPHTDPHPDLDLSTGALLLPPERGDIIAHLNICRKEGMGGKIYELVWQCVFLSGTSAAQGQA